MVILELAVQGVKGLAPSVRVTFKQGYTLLQAQSAGGSIWRLIDALCYSDGRSDTSDLVAPGAAQARAGLTFQGRDGQTYRLVRELGGPGTLAKMDGTGKFMPISSDAAEISQYLRATVGLPTRGAYEQAFSISAGTWPSQRKAAPPKNSGSFPALQKTTGNFPALQKTSGNFPALKSAPEPVASPGVQPAADVNAARATLAELQKELAATQEIDELQFRLDGLQKRTFDLGQKVREVEGLKQQAAQAAQSAQSAPSPAALGLPENVAERAARWEHLEKERDEKLRRLEKEREQFLGKNLSVPPLYQDITFMASMAVGLLTLVLGLALGGHWRYLCLLDIPAFGLAAVMAIRWVGDLQSTESLGRRKSHYDEREKQIHDAFENEVLSVKTAMKLLSVGTPGELVDLFAQRQLLERQMQDAAARLKELEQDPTLAAAQQELAGVQQEQQQIEARLGQLSGYGRPSHAVEAEIEDLKASIDAALNPKPAAAPAPAPAAPTPAPQAMSAAAAPLGQAVQPAEDPIPKLLDTCTDLFGVDVPTLGGMLATRASQYLAALTERRLSAIEIGHQGQAAVATATGKVQAGLLDAVDRDLLFLAVKVALMEKYAERAKLPYLVDDAFGAFNPNQVALIGRVLKHLGSKAQVLHLTPSPATEALADARFAV